MTHELAQVNIARLAAPIDSPRLTQFVDALDHVNALAEASAGFLWRLKSDTDSADVGVNIGANIRASDVVAFAWDSTPADAGVIVNLSVWADAKSLHDFVFSGDHVSFLRRRREWFVPMKESYAVCWWVAAGHRPSTDEAEERVRYRRAHGSTPYAFDLKDPHPAP
jgi:Domain of unknown function (DUF3291)